ncbi:OpgC family protein [Alsobacter sp. SYSU BS001988]
MSTGSEAARRARDPRLDFFRGLGMCIILIAHIPWNPWTNWIPARFGFSDAADMFVFCSGMASAIAFGAVFDRHGWWAGARRIVHRLWQVYWAHVCVVFVVLAVAVGIDQRLGVDHYVREELLLQPMLDAPGPRLLGLLTLRYVPNYFDILPMYLVILAMTPAAMLLASRDPLLAIGASVALWTGAQLGLLELTADAATGRPWFFNPFAWQMLFFTGFAFARGWLPPPPRSGGLMLAALVAVAASAPFSCQREFACYAGFGAFPALGDAHDALGPWISKTQLGPLRYAHFLGTAYLAYLAVGEGGRRLSGAVAGALRRIGRQTLAVFLTGLVAAQVLGAALDVAGRSPIAVLAVNIAGQLILFGAALVVSAFKAPSGRARTKKAPEAQPGLHPASAYTRGAAPADAAGGSAGSYLERST